MGSMCLHGCWDTGFVRLWEASDNIWNLMCRRVAKSIISITIRNTLYAILNNFMVITQQQKSKQITVMWGRWHFDIYSLSVVRQHHYLIGVLLHNFCDQVWIHNTRCYTLHFYSRLYRAASLTYSPVVLCPAFLTYWRKKYTETQRVVRRHSFKVLTDKP